MQLSSAQRFTAGFAAASLVLLVGVLSFWSARDALNAGRWVAHTHEVQRHLDALLASLVEVETAQRGYVITGRPEYLEPYERGSRGVESATDALRRLTRDNANQQARLDSLVPLLRDRIRLAAHIIETRRGEGLAPAAALVTADQGLRLMNQARRLVAHMQGEENALLERRSAERERRERTAAIVTVGGAAVAFALVVLMIQLIRQHVTMQERAALERDRLLAREQVARAQLAAIQRVSDAALAPLALDDLLTELMHRLRDVLGVDTACVHLVMRDGEQLQLCKCVGPTEEIAERVHVPVGRGVVGRIAAGRTTMAIPDLARTSEIVDPVLRAHFASLLGAPLVVPARVAVGGSVDVGNGEHVIGVLHVETLAPRTFSPDEIALLALVAERAASAIERARLYQAERRSEERFRLLVDQVQDYAIYLMDTEGRVSSWNAGAERVSGWRATEIVGESVDLLYPPVARERGVPAEHLRRAVANGRWAGQEWQMRQDGSRFWGEMILTALRHEEDQHLLGFAMVTRDLTTQKRMEQALVAAKEVAEAANAAKSRFLATISHEIRTPLSAILGYTDLLDLGLDGELTEAQHARLARVRASGQHLLNLVNELLDLAKIEAEQLRVERVRGSAHEAIAASLALVYPQAAARQMQVVNHCDHENDVQYLGDPHRVQQVLTNLIANAVKFTPPGGRVDLACGLVDAATARHDMREKTGTGDGCWCFVRVTDNGPGVAPAMHETIFAPFRQAGIASVQSEGSERGAGASAESDSVRVDNAYTRTHGGAGLGLAISRQLARLMGGDLTLRSTPGHGALHALVASRTLGTADRGRRAERVCHSGTPIHVSQEHATGGRRRSTPRTRFHHRERRCSPTSGQEFTVEPRHTAVGGARKSSARAADRSGASHGAGRRGHGRGAPRAQ